MCSVGQDSSEYSKLSLQIIRLSPKHRCVSFGTAAALLRREALCEEQTMSKPEAWFRTVLAFFLVLIACALSASPQSSRGTLTVSLRVVPSTALILGEDGRARIIEANGTNGLTVTLIDAPVTFDRSSDVGVTRTHRSTATTPQAQQATQVPVASTDTK